MDIKYIDEEETKLIANIGDSIKTKNDRAEKIPSPVYNNDKKWVKDYIEQFGTEPSFF